MIEAVLFDFGGVFTASPFDAAGSDQMRELIFGPYDQDTEHPWHRLERGELSLAAARELIIALGAREGVDSDPFAMFERMGRDGGGREARTSFVERTRKLRGSGYHTALVTNNVSEFSRAWRRMVPVDELFEVVVDSSEEGVRKPDPAIFQLTLERLGGIQPECALFLDDHLGNVVAAEALGIRAIQVEAEPTAALAALDALLAERA